MKKQKPIETDRKPVIIKDIEYQLTKIIKEVLEKDYEVRKVIKNIK